LLDKGFRIFAEDDEIVNVREDSSGRLIMTKEDTWVSHQDGKTNTGKKSTETIIPGKRGLL
jgi:hypothetical protein